MGRRGEGRGPAHRSPTSHATRRVGGPGGCSNPAAEATSDHFAGPPASPAKKSGGLEVPSSNLGAPIEKSSANAAIFVLRRGNGFARVAA
jgi:hypothetical protein